MCSTVIIQITNVIAIPYIGLPDKCGNRLMFTRVVFLYYEDIYVAERLEQTERRLAR